MPKIKGFFTASLIFADIKGFTTLTKDAQLVEFYESIYPQLCAKVKSFTPLYMNSWGDALFCVFEDPIAAAHAALAIRDFFRAFNWADTQLPMLQIRVSLHSGRAYRGQDPITGQTGYIGTQINLAARIEPIVKPGEVWTTDTFVSLMKTANPEHLDTDNLGVKPLAKKWGGQEIHRLRLKSKPQLSNENIYEKVESVGVDSVAAVLALFERGDDKQKHRAVDMMGKKNDPTFLEKLCSLVQDGTLPLNLRLMGIASIGEMKNSKAIPTLSSIIEAKENDDPRVHQACIRAIASIGDLRSGKVIVSILQSRKEYPELVIKQAIEALAFLKYQPAILQAMDMLKDPNLDIGIARTIMSMLSMSGDERCIPAVLPFLDKNHSSEEREAAIQVIVMYNPKSIKDDLIKIAKEKSESLSLRSTAFAGLAKLDTIETKAVLAEIVEQAEVGSANAANYLIEGKERVEKQEKGTKEKIQTLIW